MKTHHVDAPAPAAPRHGGRWGHHALCFYMAAMFMMMTNYLPLKRPFQARGARQAIVGTGGYSGDFTASETGFRTTQKSGHEKVLRNESRIDLRG